MSAGLNHENFEANARLIAAAPELLEALYVAAGQLRVFQAAYPSAELTQAIEMAEAAFTKATGEKA